MISKATGKTGETAEKLAEALKKEMNQSPSSVQQFSDKAIALLRSVLPAKDKGKTGDEYLTAVTEHLKLSKDELQEETDKLTTQLATALKNSNLANAAEVDGIEVTALLKLAGEKIKELETAKNTDPSAIQAKVAEIYKTLI